MAPVIGCLRFYSLAGAGKMWAWGDSTIGMNDTEDGAGETIGWKYRLPTPPKNSRGRAKGICSTGAIPYRLSSLDFIQCVGDARILLDYKAGHQSYLRRPTGQHPYFMVATRPKTDLPQMCLLQGSATGQSASPAESRFGRSPQLSSFIELAIDFKFVY